MYINYKCRKCGKFISQQFDDYYDINRLPRSGALFSNEDHPNCTVGIVYGESVFCDMISKSNQPIEGTVDIIYLKWDRSEWIHYKKVIIMLEILQFIFSSFWIWLGSLILVVVILEEISDIIHAFRVNNNKDEGEE